MAIYNPKSLKAEEFINDGEILETIKYAEENKNILSGICYFSLCLFLLVKLLQTGSFFGKKVKVNSAHSETCCHRLTKAVAFTTQLIITTGKIK